MPPQILASLLAWHTSRPILNLRLYVAPELCWPIPAGSLQDLADTVTSMLFLAGVPPLRHEQVKGATHHSLHSGRRGRTLLPFSQNSHHDQMRACPARGSLLWGMPVCCLYGI